MSRNSPPHLVAMRSRSSSLRLLLRPRPPLGLPTAEEEEWDLRERIGLMNILDILDASLNTQLFRSHSTGGGRTDDGDGDALLLLLWSFSTDIESSTEEGGNLTSSFPSFRRIYVIHSVFFRVLLSHRSGDRTLTPASVRMSDMTGKSLSPSLNGSIFGAEREVRTSVL